MASAGLTAIIRDMRALPHGTVTLFFADIEGSTRLLTTMGSDYAPALEGHRRQMRQIIEQHRGVEVDTQGDGVFAAFASATDAVAAASEAQRALADGPIRLRVGIHTGEPSATDSGYVGVDVHRAARIMSAGHGGQVLISDTTRRLIGNSFELRPMGEHRLKDLAAPERLYQLGAFDFPPLRTRHRTNLPVQSSRLVGRERELREASELLRSSRLLTLTGPGGSGKTRLAIALATDTLDAFDDGVFWVPLQAITDPHLVERAVASSVGADQELIDYIADKQILVVLDNFEQVMAAAPTVASVLAAAAGARMIVTSREPLHLDGERRYPVQPLAEDDAVSLFVERARAVEPAFEATPLTTQVCTRLDGLPLAIELAAARVSVLSEEDLFSRLDRRLPLLTSRTPGVPERQRTLRATIAWSYELLDEADRTAFARLAVFGGSFSLAAAEAICLTDLDVLDSLVLKSLIRHRADGRFILLDTIREFALDRFGEMPDAEQVARRFAEFFEGVAESTNLNHGILERRPERFDIANLEQHNFRTALTWALARNEIELGMRLATSLEQFWVTNDPHEGRRWFEALSAAPGAEAADLSVRAPARRAYGGSVFINGDPVLAESIWRQSLAEFDELGDQHGRAVLLHRLAISAMVRGAHDDARRMLAECQTIHEKTGDIWGQAQTAGTFGAMARDAGDSEKALALFEQSARMAADMDVYWWQGGMLAEMASICIDAGRLDDAERYARQSLALADQLNDRPGRIFGIGIFARLAAERGQWHRAGLLWAAVENEDAVSPLGGWRRHRGAFESRVVRPDEPDFMRGITEGRATKLSGAVSIALEELGEAG